MKRTTSRRQEQGFDPLRTAVHRALADAVPRRLGGGLVVLGLAVSAAQAAPGVFPAELELDALDGSNGFVLNGIDPSDHSGRSVAGAGDVNGDGIDDLIIGADGADPGGDSSAGESYVVFGGESVGAGGSIELSALDGTNGFVLNGIDFYDRSGRSVAGAGDVNGDGIYDLIIGAYGADPDDRSYAGESYVVFGRGDTDGDGVNDAEDNCTMVSNDSQCDTDTDGYGNHCDADLNNDGGVTQGDLGLFRNAFGQTGDDLDADLNCDGGVTPSDLDMFRSLFNKPPGPSSQAP
ncbi:hypothetical protein BH24PSE2_BH24PSE2_11990 [soil metagenome]